MAGRPGAVLDLRPMGSLPTRDGLLGCPLTDLRDGNYRIEAGPTDFNYFVRSATRARGLSPSGRHTPASRRARPHAGEALFVVNFDSYADTLDHGQWGTVNLTAPSEGPAAGHWWAKADGNGGWLGVTAELVQGSAFEGSIASTSGKFCARHPELSRRDRHHQLVRGPERR